MNQKIDTIEAGRTFSLSWKGRLIILTAALVALGVFVYPETLRELLWSVLHREGSSHGLFVPFISGYFFWLKRKNIGRLEPCFSLLPGTIIAVAGLFILYISRTGSEFTLSALSFMVIVFGLVWALFGTQMIKELSFPILFLITMIPMPRPIYNQIAEGIREITTSGSVWLMQLIQLPIFREGYNIQLPSTNLFIDIGCSGIRYLVSYFVFSLAYAFLCKRTFKGKLLVALSSFPIAVIAGVLRLSSIYLSVHFISPFMAEYVPHVLLSWFVFGVLLVASITVDQILSVRFEAKSIGQRA